MYGSSSMYSSTDLDDEDDSPNGQFIQISEQNLHTSLKMLVIVQQGTFRIDFRIST